MPMGSAGVRVNPKILRRALDSLYQEWRKISYLIWVLEGVKQGKPRRGRPPRFETMSFMRRRRAPAKK
jgi:hypothetical protein